MKIVAGQRSRKGFTIIELMMVSAIIGLLATIAIPKFANLITKSRESAVRGSLGAVRGSLTVYYSDMEGVWPRTLATLAGKYLAVLPTLTIPAVSGVGGHPASSAETNVIDDGANRWAYFLSSGGVRVNCTHTDTKASLWSTL